MDDLESLRKYHEQVFRSFEDQLGRLIESHQEAVAANQKAHEESKLRMDRTDAVIAQVGRELTNLTEYTRHAVELDIRAYRRERQQRRKEIREAEERIAKQRAPKTAPSGSKGRNESSATWTAGSKAQTEATAAEAQFRDRLK